ncbi:hypothetical protein CAEBREN_17892 [Caenorhabditis brenneri]|uniref:Uncharacterized protein n=1 Tax=Caenorhabditis brenneri TaxID=135651 RepID=G0PAR4_CAEBE|nr:hypothetical protein CAEBREN_17892 [Caenorhabditis brenneri]
MCRYCFRGFRRIDSRTSFLLHKTSRFTSLH